MAKQGPCIEDQSTEELSGEQQGLGTASLTEQGGGGREAPSAWSKYPACPSCHRLYFSPTPSSLQNSKRQDKEENNKRS